MYGCMNVMECNVMYCTVLYCTVLNFTGGQVLCRGYRGGRGRGLRGHEWELQAKVVNSKNK